MSELIDATELAKKIFSEYLPDGANECRPFAEWVDDGRTLEICYDNHKGEIEAFMFDLADPTAIEQLWQVVWNEMCLALPAR